MFSHEGWEIVAHAKDEMIANMIKGVLENEEIEVMLRSHELIAHGSVFGDLSSEGNWGEIFVPIEKIDDAKRIVNEYLANSEIDDTDEEI